MNSCVFTALYFASFAAAFRVLPALLPAVVSCAYSSIACCFLTFAIACSLYPTFKKRYFTARLFPRDKAVLITGCDTGFGHELAKRLDSKGFHVFASCLNPSSDGAKKLKETSSERLQVFGLDVSKDESVKQAVDYVRKNLGTSKFWAVVNNAGMFKGFDVALNSIDDYKELLDVNAVGMVRVTKAFLSMLIDSKGRVVNVTSLESRATMPYTSAYAMSKYACRAFSEILRQEMWEFGVKVIEIEPEGFRTNLTDYSIVTRVYDETVSRAGDMKQLYGSSYFKEFKKFLARPLNMSSPRIYKVVDCMENAVSLAEPSRVYKAHRNFFADFVVFVLEITPTPVLDFGIVLAKRYWGCPIPDAAKRHL